MPGGGLTKVRRAQKGRKEEKNLIIFRPDKRNRDLSLCLRRPGSGEGESDFSLSLVFPWSRLSRICLDLPTPLIHYVCVCMYICFC